MKKYKKSFKTKRKRSVAKALKKTVINKFFLLALLFIILTAGIVYFLLFSSFFQIKSVEVSGCQKLSCEELKNAIRKNAGKNILLSNLANATKTLNEKYPLISDVSIKRILPNKITARVEERKPVIALSFSSGFYLIDKEGVAFEKSPDIPSDIPEIRNESLGDSVNLGESIIDKNSIEDILKIEEGFSESFKIPIDKIVIASSKKTDIITKEGWKVYFNPEKDIDWQIEQLGIILREKIPSESRQNIEYIDLRFDKIYIFPENY